MLSAAELRETDVYRDFARAWYRGRLAANRKDGAITTTETRAKNKAKGIT